MSEKLPILSIDDYSLAYLASGNTVRILNAVSLEIGRGEVLGLVGESGSAKSSLANAIMRDLPGRIAYETGRIVLGDDELTALEEHALEAVRGERLAMVFQDASSALNPTQTLGGHVEETFRCHRQLSAAEARRQTIDLFATVGLPDPERMCERYAHEVSGGEKQRVLLALAFACEPELILFDEPTSALDATTAATLLDLFADLQARTGVAGLYISHDLGTVAAVAHRIAVIYGGHIVELASPDALFSNPQHPYTRALLESLPRPSDTRTGRQLAVSVAKPAPRTGPAPACIYSASCARHEASICDQQPVQLRVVEERLVACAHLANRPDEQRQAEAVETLAPSVSTSASIVSPAPAAAAGTSNTRDAAQRDAEPVESVLSVLSLHVSYGKSSLLSRLFGRASQRVHAVNDASFELRRGETVGLVGESGCGKSTLARALGGLVDYSGEIRLDGKRVDTRDKHYRSRVQMIFQNPDSSLNPRHSVATILSRPLRLFQTLDTEAQHRETTNILARVGLPASTAERFPHQLSGGEKQRVAIARALAAKPDVIVCDEITSGLDAAVQASIVKLLRGIQRESGTAMIFITHDLAILRHVADRLAVMYLGEIVEMRSVASLDQPPYHPYTEALMSSSPSVDPLSITRRVRLAGSLPKRTVRLVGCPFDSRCPRRLGDTCAQQPPPWQEAGSTHALACHIPLHTLQSVPPVWHVPNQLENSRC